MRKLIKVFISHHHTHANQLGQLKKHLPFIGCEGFLAHNDINPGEHDLERIENELKTCDILLYVCGQDANESAFCQQEIGMAKALDKEIISVMSESDNSPKGFIARIQAINCKDVGQLYDDILPILYKHNQEAMQHLDVLACERFSHREDTNKSTIYLKVDNWNDYHFMTRFSVEQNNTRIGYVSIAYEGQQERLHTSHFIPSTFLCLPNNFFSHFCPEEPLDAGKKDSLCHLLNDVSTLTKEKLEQIKAEPVLKNSLFRGELNKFEELIEVAWRDKPSKKP